MLSLGSKLGMKKAYKYITIAVLGLMITTISIPGNAQCPMCKLSAEQNLKMGGTAGKGLNRGILFMFAMPYLIVGTLGFYWIRNKHKEGEEKEANAEEY